jgi:two-component system, OmpR family, response regulator VanR
VLIVEDEPYLAEAIRDGLRLDAIAADVAGDGDTAMELLGVNAYDVAVLDRDIPGLSGDEVAERIVASRSGMPILMLTAADRLDDKASGFGLGADDYLTKPFELRELVLRLRALERRRAHHRPPVREVAGLRLDPFRREVHRDGRYVALTRKQFAVLDVLVGAEGGVVSAEELLERAWDENADPFTNAVRITVSALRKRLGEPPIIATVAGVGYRIDAERSSSERADGTERSSSERADGTERSSSERADGTERSSSERADGTERSSPERAEDPAPRTGPGGGGRG